MLVYTSGGQVGGQSGHASHALHDQILGIARQTFAQCGIDFLM